MAALIIGLSYATSFALIPKAQLKPSEYDLGVTFQQAANDDRPMIAVFYVDWCTYCQRFMPRLDKIRNINKNNINVVLVNCDDVANKSLVNEYKIGAFPTVYIIDAKYDNRVHIDNAYLETVTSLNTEVQRYLNFRKFIKGDKCK